ncbi:hypothetical protein FJ937_16735 [Mesorhizobium sp. B2-4-4]|uniref:hypothetical protein n=1 Tax=Mesorhizobium sp. B2-4-4 TaxID=2589945 RepID=UPI00112C1170|nr:hypothetical protein [Mesorhizobium sp. B2-4-4]TPL49131.1 hypothetical protein FJ937_16735 [Mesorhizobium sp. B2-4-4]
MAADRPWNGKIETLGDLRDHGMGLRGHCRAPNSSHSRVLDLDKLIRLFGEDYVYIKDEEIGRRFVLHRVRLHRRHDYGHRQYRAER